MTGEDSGRIPRRLQSVRDEIAAAARAAGRDPASVLLVAVTKRVASEAVVAAAAAGQRDFGENYVQEGLRKIEAVSMPQLRWHLIGALQSNKAARAARAFHLLHSVGSRSVAEAISKEMTAAGREARVLVQVKLGGGDARLQRPRSHQGRGLAYDPTCHE